jgi:3-hydroxyisobutyrate dehydrogenase-like beta-hydroxyacid dehydrogenase
MNQKSDSKVIGLIGIGLVGTALAERLLADGYSVTGYDIVPAQCDRLRELGGRAADSPRDVAEAVDYLLLSLPDTDVVREVVEGTAGVLSAQRIPPYIIDTTTGGPDETVELAARLTPQGCSFLDATIGGASSQIRSGEAVITTGGAREAFDACAALLGTLAKRVFYVGPSGSGSKSKLAANLVLGLNRLVLAEGLVFAEKLGLEPGTFLEVLRAGPAYSVAMDVKGRKMLEGDFTPQSRIRQHRKDVSLMLKYAQDREQDLPLSRVHFDILESAIAAGEGELDTCAVLKEIKRRTTGADQNNGKDRRR